MTTSEPVPDNLLLYAASPRAACTPRFAALRSWLGIAFALHFLIGGLYIAILPLWGAVPDEPLHYSRIKYEAEIGPLPLITDPRKWDEPLAVYCFTADPCGTAQHGPLYYWAAAPIFKLTSGMTIEGQQYMLRIWSLLLGAAALPIVLAILRLLFPDDEKLCGLALIAVTLLPHRLLMSAVIYNDIAMALAMAFAVWTLVRAASDCGNERLWVIAGLALGTAYLVKSVALVALPASVIALLLQQRRLQWSLLRTLRCFALWCVAFLIVAGWFIARNITIYGKLFPTEPALPEYSWLQMFFGVPLNEFMTMLGYTLRGFWYSIWSQVGWLPLMKYAGIGTIWFMVTNCIYGALFLISLAFIIGYFAGIKSGWRGLPRASRDMIIVFFFVLAGMIYGALDWVMLHSFHNFEETGKHAIAISVCLVALLAAAYRQLLGARNAYKGMAATVTVLACFNGGSVLWLTTNLIPNHRPPRPALVGERVRDVPSGVAPGIWHRYSVPGVVQRGGTVARPAKATEPALVAR